MFSGRAAAASTAPHRESRRAAYRRLASFSVAPAVHMVSIVSIKCLLLHVETAH